MPQYCLVKHHIVSSVIDGPDVGNEPDTLPISGDVTFYPVLGHGDSVVVTAGAEKVSYVLSPISARIVNGKIFVNGEEGVKLFAGGPDSNPDRIRYRAKFTGLNIAGNKRIDLKDILFEAIPGGELTLSVAQPVPGAPYPGYSATIEQGIAQIGEARDEALGQVSGAVVAALGEYFMGSTNLFHKEDVTLDAVIPAGASEPVPNATYAVSDPIAIVPGEPYSYAGVSRSTFLDQSGGLVGYVTSDASATGSWTAPDGATHVRLSLLKIRLEIAQLNAGSELLPYEPWHPGSVRENRLPGHLWFELAPEDIGAQPVGDYIEGPVHPHQTSFFETSTNLFDMSKITTGMVIPRLSATPVANAQYAVSDPIPVTAGQDYSFDNLLRLTWLDSAGAHVGTTDLSSDGPRQVTAPGGSVSVRISVSTAMMPTAQLNSGTALLPYEPGSSARIPSDYLDFSGLTPESIGAQSAGNYLEGVVTPERTSFFESPSNLFTPTDALVDMVIQSGTGTPTPLNSWSVSTPIPVTGGAQYTYAGALRLTFLAGSTYVSTVNAPASLTGTVTAPASATHVRLSYRTTGQDTVQLNAGPELLPYEPGGSAKIPTRYLDIEGVTPGGGSDITTADPVIIDTAGLEEIYTAPIIEAQPDLPATYPEDVYGWWDQLVTDHPGYVTRRDLGLASDGVTPMYAYTLRPQEVPTHVSGSVDPGLASPLPAAMLVAGTHGYEEAGVYHLWRLAKALCEEWESSPVLDAMRWNFEIVAVPLVNPVGWMPDNTGRHNANGVDLARNFDADWRPATADVPSGTAPLSEPETLAVDTLMREVADRCVLGSSFHNFSATADRKWLTIWQAAPTPMMLNLGKRLIARMSRKWRAEYEWVTVPETYFGYADRGAPLGSEGRAFVAHSIPGSTFETTQRLFLDGGAGTPRSSDAMTLGFEATVNYVAMGLLEGLRLKR